MRTVRCGYLHTLKATLEFGSGKARATLCHSIERSSGMLLCWLPAPQKLLLVYCECQEHKRIETTTMLANLWKIPNQLYNRTSLKYAYYFSFTELLGIVPYLAFLFYFTNYSYYSAFRKTTVTLFFCTNSSYYIFWRVFYFALAHRIEGGDVTV